MINITDELRELFDEFRIYFGLSDEVSLNKQLEFENKFSKVECEYFGHEFSKSKVCYHCGELKNE
jgi:hypothetical protein